MALIADRAANGAQFVIASHSPLIMTIPEAEILAIEKGSPARVALEDTEHFQNTRAVFQNPGAFWKRLLPQSKRMNYGRCSSSSKNASASSL